MRKKTILLGILMSASVCSLGQTSQLRFDESQDFRKAKYLYLTETFKAAQNKFEKVLDNGHLSRDTKEASEFYASMVALINDERGAEERFLSFQDNYPKSVYVRNGSWELGSFYLRKGDFKKAYKYLTLESINNLPERKRKDYQFKLGYASFMLGKERKALSYFEPLTESGKYQDEASYYTGHIYYSQKDFDKAFEYFDTLRNRNSEYENKVLPYVVQIEFNEGKYNEAIRDGKNLLGQNRSKVVQSEVSKIIGESYFKQKKYDEAIPYLEAYTGEKTNADYYQLGYAYYQKGEFERATSLFNKIIDEENPLAQTAYYQLGNAYLKTDKKREALTAYKSASEMNFDREVQEDANYNYAKLSYDIGNPFTGTPEVLQAFTQKYPHSKYVSEVNDYLIDAFISSGNYKNAIDVLSAIRNKTTEQKVAEQKVAFLYATELVKEGKIVQAEPYFAIASKSNLDMEIKARATFWQGECNYRMGKYDKALSNFKRFKTLGVEVPETKELNYQLGYTYLKLKKYENAADAFETYIATNPPGNFKADAKLRLADSYIGTKNTSKALELYEDISEGESPNSDEAAYNRAVVLGILGKHQEKISALESFLRSYPVSKYFENAQVELAEAYLRVGNNRRALEHLEDLIAHGKPEMVARARLRKGLIHYNAQDNNKALREFKTVAEDYPSTQLALQAIDNAKRIYIEQNDLNDFERWANGLSYYQVDQSELESLAYDSAKRLYDEKNYTQAISALRSFVSKYPKSVYASAANYALGESYYQTNAFDSAKEPLTKVAKVDSEFKEDALLRLSQIYLNADEKTEALLTLEALYNISKNPSYKAFSEIHLMRLYSERNQHNKAVKMAEKVLSNLKNETAVLQEAELTKARSLFASGKKNKAREAYAQLESASSNSVKAEAMYHKALFLNQDKKYEVSNETVFYLASKFSEQQYWASKSLIIMADNYYNLDDLYQANVTLDAVLENYQDYPDVVSEAKKLKQKIN